jgi:transcriptional regulator with XRE-family HTH domain
MMRIETASALGRTLRAERTRLHRTQRQVAAQAGVERSWLARLEGGRENPTFAKLLAVTSALGLQLHIVEAGTSTSDRTRLPTPIDLDEVLASFDRPV